MAFGSIGQRKALASDTAAPHNDGEHFVTQMVHHAEPASQISPEEAAAVMDVQFAGFIERNLGAVPGNIVADGTSSEVREMISISKLNRNVAQLRSELCGLRGVAPSPICSLCSRVITPNGPTGSMRTMGRPPS